MCVWGGRSKNITTKLEWEKGHDRETGPEIRHTLLGRGRYRVQGRTT